MVAGLSVDWHAPVVWQSPVPKVVYPGETIHLAAILEEKPNQVPSLTATASHLIMTPPVPGPAAAEAGIAFASTAPTLTRIVGARFLRDAIDTESASQIAMKYQLVTEHTNLFMVVQRAADDKARGLPAPHQIKQMVAAGWHGMGSVRQVDVSAMRMLSAKAIPHEIRLSHAAQFITAPEKSRYMRRQVEPTLLGIEPIALLEILEDVSLAHADLEDAMTRFLNCGIPSEIEAIIEVIADRLSDRVLAWAVFLDWLIIALDQASVAPRQVMRLLNYTLSGLLDEQREAIHQRLNAELPEISEDHWGALGDDAAPLDIDVLIHRQNL
jgi:hypothetical protein